MRGNSKTLLLAMSRLYLNVTGIDEDMEDL